MHRRVFQPANPYSQRSQLIVDSVDSPGLLGAGMQVMVVVPAVSVRMVDVLLFQQDGALPR